MAAQPNILMIVTDQHRADHLGCYGNQVVRTPHIDAIAARGTAFDRFHVASPVCMPNRASLMTGRMPSVHGVRSNGVPLSLAATTFVEVLRAAGYATALVGKAHLQCMIGAPPILTGPAPKPGAAPPAAGLAEARHAPYGDGRYDQELVRNWHNPDHRLDLPFYGFDHVELVVDHGDRADGAYGRWLEARHPGAHRLRGAENALPGSRYIAPQAWRTAVPEELYSTTWIADNTIAWLTSHAGRRDRQPFFLQCSFPDPHHPFTPPGRYWDMYDPAEVALPASFGHGDGAVPPTVRSLRLARRDGRAETGGTNPFAVTEREARETIALSYGMITMIDDAIGRVMATLAETGMAADTVVIFTADHGDFMGDHGLMLKGPIHYQGLIRVPFIWADPARPAAAGRSDALAGTIDIAPTILARAGILPFNGVQGADLLPVIAGGTRGVREAIVVEEDSQRAILGFDRPVRARTLVTQAARLTLYDGAEWGELYDLADDPDEMANLWDDPGATELRRMMAESLARALISQADTSPLPTHRA